MNDNNAYKGEITFQSLFGLVKRSFVRIVVYAIVAAVVVGAITGIIMLAVNENGQTYQAIIEFNYKGVEEGLDPWGRKLDVTKIKADNIINKSLTDNNFSEEERSRLKGKIKDNISIAGIVPEDIMEKIMIIKEIATKNPLQLNELHSLSYNSTRFVVTLQNDKELGLKKKQCIDLLNSIVDNYIEEFKKTYGYDEVLGTLIGEEVDFSYFDYVELYDVYNTQVEDIIRYLNAMIEMAGNFRSASNKMTFADMHSRVMAIRNYNIKALETYIFDKGIASERSIIDVQTYIQEKLDNIDIEIQATEQLLADTERAMKDVFEAYYNTKKDANGNEERYLANGEIYQQYSNNLMLYQTNLVEQQTIRTLWSNRLQKFNDAEQLTDEEREALVLKADEMIEKINFALKKEIEFINEAVNEYIEYEVMKDSIRKAVSATKAKNEAFNIKLLILIEVLTVFLAAIAAMTVTNIKEKKIAAMKDNAQTQSENKDNEKSE